MAHHCAPLAQLSQRERRSLGLPSPARSDDSERAAPIDDDFEVDESAACAPTPMRATAPPTKMADSRSSSSRACSPEQHSPTCNPPTIQDEAEGIANDIRVLPSATYDALRRIIEAARQMFHSKDENAAVEVVTAAANVAEKPPQRDDRRASLMKEKLGGAHHLAVIRRLEEKVQKLQEEIKARDDEITRLQIERSEMLEVGPRKMIVEVQGSWFGKEAGGKGGKKADETAACSDNCPSQSQVGKLQAELDTVVRILSNFIGNSLASPDDTPDHAPPSASTGLATPWSANTTFGRPNLVSPAIPPGTGHSTGQSNQPLVSLDPNQHSHAGWDSRESSHFSNSFSVRSMGSTLPFNSLAPVLPLQNRTGSSPNSRRSSARALADWTTPLQPKGELALQSSIKSQTLTCATLPSTSTECDGTPHLNGPAPSKRRLPRLSERNAERRASAVSSLSAASSEGRMCSRRGSTTSSQGVVVMPAPVRRPVLRSKSLSRLSPVSIASDADAAHCSKDACGSPVHAHGNPV